MALQIYLYGDNEQGFLDIDPNTVLEMDNLNDLFDEDLTSGEFSLPVEIPWTEGNRRKMSFAERVENFKQSKNYWVVDVYNDGFPELIKSKLTILEKTGTFTYMKGKFSANISGNKGLFGSAIKNKRLRDLTLGGQIDFPLYDSRSFATLHMKGFYPQYWYMAFAPVAIEGFFDQGKDYNDEFIAKDTANYIVPLVGDLNLWEFGRPKSTNPLLSAEAGQPEYIDYRTIPFFNFKYVVVEAFALAGYTVSGDLLDTNDFVDLYLFNNQAIDFFSSSVYLDYNRKIVPTDHVPDLLLLDFFRNFFKFFNVYPVIGATHVQLKYRNQTLKDRKILNITNLTDLNFKSTFEEVTDDSGYTLQYGWDTNDTYRDDRIKDLTTKTYVATVATANDLPFLDIGRPYTTDDYAYVSSENMYYSVANAVSVPALWEAWGEALDEVKVGEGGRSVDLGMGTLCTYVELDEDLALYQRRDRVGCKMLGSYWTNKGKQVKNAFGLSVFYIKKTVVDGKNIPTSFNHNTAPAGTVLEKYSLALSGPNGMAENFHNRWQQINEQNETVTVTVIADKKLMTDLEAHNTLQIQNILFVPKTTKTTIPNKGSIDIELKPI